MIRLLLFLAVAPIPTTIVVQPSITYAVYTGTNSRIYTATNLVGGLTTATVKTVPGRTNYAAVKAVNYLGLSDFSDELAWVPTINSSDLEWDRSATPASPVILTIGATIQSSGSPGGPWTNEFGTNWLTLTNPGSTIKVFRVQVTVTNR